MERIDELGQMEVKKIDELGRVVIPMGIRKKLNLDITTEVSIRLNENKIEILKHKECCHFCKNATENKRSIAICDECYKKISFILMN